MLNIALKLMLTQWLQCLKKVKTLNSKNINGN